jgi:hypothetical protein
LYHHPENSQNVPGLEKTSAKARLQSMALFAEISGAESLGEIGAGA